MLVLYIQSAATGCGMDAVWCGMVRDRAAAVARPEALLATQSYIDMAVAEARDKPHSQKLADILIVGRRLMERGLLDKHFFGEQLMRVSV